MQATLGRLETELQAAKQQHAQHLSELKQQQVELEGKASSMLHQAQLRLSHSAAAEAELSAMRDKAVAAAELEVLVEAASQRSERVKAAVQRVDQEVEAEVAAYKATRRSVLTAGEQFQRVG